MEIVEFERPLDLRLNIWVQKSRFVFRKHNCVSPPHNFIIKLALTTAGTTRDDVQRLTGERGILALEDMLDAGLIIEEREILRVGGNGFRLMDIDDIRFCCACKL